VRCFAKEGPLETPADFPFGLFVTDCRTPKSSPYPDVAAKTAPAETELTGHFEKFAAICPI